MLCGHSLGVLGPVYKSFGLTEQDLEQHFAGPAFLAWVCHPRSSYLPRSCTVLSSCMLCRVAWATFARGVGLCKLYVVVACYSRASNKASCAVPIVSLDGCSLTRAPCGSGSGMPRQLCRSKSSSGKLNSACKVCCRVLLATCLRYNLRSPRLRACTPCHHVFGCYARRSRRRSRTPTSRVARCGTPSRSSTEVTICWSRLTQRSRRSAPN